MLTFCKKVDIGLSDNKTNESVAFCGTQALEESNARTVNRVTGINGNYETGRKIFKQNCAVCHSLTDQDLTGPGLKGLYDRIPKPQVQWLHRYILNNEKVKSSGDIYSLMLRDKYKERVGMTVFEGQLSEKEINDLMYYVFGH